MEELVVNADTDDENGIGESIDEGEENVEDIEIKVIVIRMMKMKMLLKQLQLIRKQFMQQNK